MVELSVNYRTPAEAMALAGRVLAVAIPDARLPESVRSTGEEPQLVPVPSEGGLPSTVAACALGERGAVGDGTVAVLCAASLVDDVAAALERADIPFGTTGRGALDSPVTLLPVEMAKGLEFDAVVVVEPTRLVREAANGLQALYVALTRTTHRLTLVHAEPLPEVLAAT